ncbi:MAG: hypothetical protein RQ756_06385 [Flavobacteriaceae bacterium]|nr:hypothetical protein [Flavobacteriaceae bacterium]
MEITVEIVCTVFSEDYEPQIQAFIKNLRQSPFKVEETALTTLVFGDFEQVLPFVNQLMYKFFKQNSESLVSMRIIPGDRSGYKPNF